MNYALGVTLANLQDLETLGLPEPLYQPLSDFVPYSGRRLRMDGVMVGTGRASFTWHFPELTLGEYGTLLYFVTDGGVLQASREIYARTRIIQSQMSDRVFANFKCTMLLPFEPDDAEYRTNRFYKDMSVSFINGVEQT